MIWATSTTDASWCPDTQLGTWAAWVAIDGKRPVRAKGEFRDRIETSNRAEMMAALNGIWLAAKHGARGVLVQSDSMAVVLAAGGSSKAAAWWTGELQRHKLQGLLIKARHVKGHTASKEAQFWVNRWCHDEAIKMLRDGRNLLQS